ncbi:MAG: serine hydrolase [Gemmatimonadota bacterium]|nr:serine hydrolase [Gemmatimonadota bacterium]MDE2864461.1 serine hydrolase [Gemmatimonadota bacterium]
MTTTRRDFLKSAALAATVPTLASAAACAPDSPAGPGARQGTSSLQADLEEALARHRVVGASAAVFANGEILTAAAGLVNVNTGVKMTPDTVMHIGSITKVFNTTLLMQMVDDGLVDLSAPVSTYLPELRIADPDHLARITVGMLVNHTSGIDGEMVPEQGHDEETIEKAIPRFANMGKIHEPGADTSYCNTATVIAGYLCQRIRGRSWYDLMKERIFQPLDMEHAAVLPEDALLHRASVGHFTNPETGEPVRTSFAFLPISFAPAGATAMMSPADLVTFAAAHMADGTGLNGAAILSPESARAMRTETTRGRGQGSPVAFGLGWMLSEGGFVSHGGGGPGILATLIAHPESNVAVAVAANSSHGGGLTGELAGKWMEEAAGVAPPAPVVRPIVDAEVDVARYAGRYENIAQIYEIVEMEGGIGVSLWAKFPFYDDTPMEPTPPIALRPVGNDAFTFPDAEGNATAAIMSFLDPRPDGRMSYIAQGARMVPRVD